MGCFSENRNQNKRKIAEYINILGEFCGKREIEELSSQDLYKKYGIEQADVMVLFGGSIISGGDVMAEAMQKKIAKKYVIVGGEGHTTETLRQKMSEECSSVSTKDLSEAEIFSQYIFQKYGFKVNYLETKSTNCGNNITFLLDLLEKNQVEYKSIILCQDATMQRRMEAGLRKYVSDDRIIINYAAYKAEVVEEENELRYKKTILGMWDVNRYVNLLMGEISRLSDNEDGYGPRGKNFIAHVDIPREVSEAFEELRKTYGIKIREADSMYA